MQRKLTLIMIAAAAGILVAGRQLTRATDGFGYPPPPTAGPTRAPVYAGQEADDVATSILSKWKEQGIASADSWIVAATDVTEADSSCFDISSGLISNGTPMDVAILMSGSAISPSVPGMSDTPRPYALLVVDRKSGTPYTVLRAPELSKLKAKFDCAEKN